jgi:hypothetical protein
MRLKNKDIKKIVIILSLFVFSLSFFLIYRSIISTQKINTNPSKNPGRSEISSSVSIDSHLNQLATSDSKIITLFEPKSGAKLSSGDKITGKSTLNEVDYLLIDGETGVISQGKITVTNGTFSKNIFFKNISSSGRLDVFSTETNGKESNLIEIDVKF